MTITKHGYHIPGSPEETLPKPRPTHICGGPNFCKACRGDVAAYRESLAAEEEKVQNIEEAPEWRPPTSDEAFEASRDVMHRLEVLKKEVPEDRDVRSQYLHFFDDYQSFGPVDQEVGSAFAELARFLDRVLPPNRKDGVIRDLVVIRNNALRAVR